MKNKDSDSRGISLAKAHWEYVRGVFQFRIIDPQALEEIEFHYVTAFRHGYKHGREDNP